MGDADIARFTAWAERTLGGRVVRAERQGERRSGGRPAWFLDVARGGEALACYARMDRGAEQLISREFTLEREYRVLRALGAAGARVPRVYGTCADPAGILMERVAGEFDYTKLAPGAERDALDEEIARLAATRPRNLAEGDAALGRFIAANEGAADARLAAYLYRRAVREEALWRGALGAGETAAFLRLA